MKALEYSRVRLLMDVKGESEHDLIFPKGTIGTVIECYAVDVALKSENLVGGFVYDNLYLYPNQLEVVDDKSNG